MRVTSALKEAVSWCVRNHEGGGNLPHKTGKSPLEMANQLVITSGELVYNPVLPTW